MAKVKKGWAVHCHHSILVEHCYDYQERVGYIKTEKPENERATRLRLFRLLPKKAIAEIPKYYREADAKLQEADAKWKEASAKWEEARAKWKEADARWEEAYAKWQEAYAKWKEADAKWKEASAKWEEAYAKWEEASAKWKADGQDEWHKKWCGCKEWDGSQIVFKGH